MFSANENVLLRQHKKRIVAFVEETIPEECLDLGTQVMVMEVKCQAPGCVPLETVILIVFPKMTSNTEDFLIPGLPQSNGGNFKTKILMPMANVTKDDVLDALPPQFMGGRRSIPKLALQARDVMLGQITQLFDDKESRKLMAEYLQQQLQEFIARDCEEPVWGTEYEPFHVTTTGDNDTTFTTKVDENTGKVSNDDNLPSQNDLTYNSQIDLLRNSNKNVVIRRVLDPPNELSTRIAPAATSPPPLPSTTTATATTTTTTTTTATRTTIPIESVVARRKQQNWSRALSSTSNDPLQLLAQRQHAPGLRPVGCPCCDPDNPSNVADQFLYL